MSILRSLWQKKRKNPVAAVLSWRKKITCRTVFDSAPQETAPLGTTPPIPESETSPSSPIPGTDMERIKEIQLPESTALQPPKDEEDHTALSNAIKTLDEIDDMLEPDPLTTELPPLYLVCTAVAQQIMELITKYQSSTKVSAAVRKDYDKYVQQDMCTCKEIISACRFQPSDEECEKHLQSMREIYPRWEKTTKLLSPVPPAVLIYEDGTHSGTSSTREAMDEYEPVPPVMLTRNYFIKAVDQYTGYPKYVNIMTKGTQLPCSYDYTFYINEDNPYAVSLQFYEEKKRLLKQFEMNFEKALPPGTEIKLSVSCNRSFRFTGIAEAGGNTFHFEIQLPPPPPLPTPDELNEAIAKARSRIALITEPGRRIVVEKRFNRLFTELKDAIDDGDAERVNDIMEKEIHILEPRALQPSRDVFERRVRELRDVFERRVRELEKLNSIYGKGSEAIAKEIREAASAGYRAYENEDQAALTNAMEMLDEFEAICQ